MRDVSSARGIRKWDIDAHRIVIMGHSYGGFVASCAARRHPEFIWRRADRAMGYQLRRAAVFRNRRRVRPAARAPSIFNDVDGRLTGADAQSLVRAIRTSGRALSVPAAAPFLIDRPVLLATATPRRSGRSGCRTPNGLGKESERSSDLPPVRYGSRLRRSADRTLETYVLDWLATLPGGPRRD